MNSDGVIKRGNPETLKALGFHLPLEDHEASKLSMMDKGLRLKELAAMRHEQLEQKRHREEKFPGQSTAYLKGANHA